MVHTVIKRDGTKVDFDGDRIRQAVQKAARAVSQHVGIEQLDEIVSNIYDLQTDELSVDMVQNAVELNLMKNHPEVARAYIVYRRERDVNRRRNSKLVQTFNEIIDVADTNVKNENANINGNTPAGQMNKFASETTKAHAIDYILNPEHARAHEEGRIHIHDLDYMPTKTTTCVQYDIEKLFKDGFNSGHGYLREPNHIRSYGALAAIAFQANQNEQHGGQAIPAFDYFMAPGVRKTFVKYFLKYANRAAARGELDVQVQNIDRAYVEANCGTLEMSNEKLLTFGQPSIYADALEDTIQETEQSMEAFLANMNSMHSRGGGQVVFSSINYGSDLTPEGRMVTAAILKACESGLGRGETAIFPIHIFKVKDGLSYSEEDYALAAANMDDALAGKLTFKAPNFDLFLRACVVSSKRLFPNFLFLDATFNQHPKWDINSPDRFRYEVATMGCRTRVFEDIHGESTSWSRGNLSFTTINLVRLAIEARKFAEQYFASDIAAHGLEKVESDIQNVAITKFNETLDSLCDVVADQLYDRYKFQCTAKAKQFPFLMGQGLWTGGQDLQPNDRVEDVLKHGTLGIGYIGLAEALKMLIGEHHGESQKAQELGLTIVNHIDKRCQDYKAKYDLNYSCLATPAEGLAGRFTGIDRRKYGSIDGVTNREYYTNSNHVPVYYPITAFEKIQIEAPYHAMTPGGHIMYVEMDAEAKKNILAFVKLIRQMYLSNVGYGSVNHPVDRCTVCGHEGTIDDSCPDCGETDKIDRIRRITGYLVGTTDRWNSYKRAEERDRVKHGM